MNMNRSSNNTQTLPNFIIIGGSRSATTSLYHYLGQHPQIYMSPIKETNYFAYDSEFNYNELVLRRFRIRTLEDYTSLFSKIRTEKIIGEASPRYLSTPFSASRIHDLLPNIKLLAILRNPVDRVYSNYFARIRRGEETDGFSDVVESEIRNFSKMEYVYSILHPGLYYTNLKRYIDLFYRNNLKINIFEDFISEQPGFFKEVLNYLDVDTNYMPDFNINYNPTGIPKNKFFNTILEGNKYTKKLRYILPLRLKVPIDRIMMRLKKRNLVKPQMPESTRERLVCFYRDEILKLQDLIERDLSAWLK